MRPIPNFAASKNMIGTVPTYLGSKLRLTKDDNGRQWNAQEIYKVLY